MALRPARSPKIAVLDAVRLSARDRKHELVRLNIAVLDAARQHWERKLAPFLQPGTEVAPSKERIRFHYVRTQILEMATA
ncbi:hypothetical protein DXG01_009901 [Tephrocybe rancida]|nr:hypothetical protein DXG01_009901 [Tephrocybe rancida]